MLCTSICSTRGCAARRACAPAVSLQLAEVQGARGPRTRELGPLAPWPPEWSLNGFGRGREQREGGRGRFDRGSRRRRRSWRGAVAWAGQTPDPGAVLLDNLDAERGLGALEGALGDAGGLGGGEQVARGARAGGELLAQQVQRVDDRGALPARLRAAQQAVRRRVDGTAPGHARHAGGRFLDEVAERRWRGAEIVLGRRQDAGALRRVVRVA